MRRLERRWLEAWLLFEFTRNCTSYVSQHATHPIVGSVGERGEESSLTLKIRVKSKFSKKQKMIIIKIIIIIIIIINKHQ